MGVSVFARMAGELLRSGVMSYMYLSDAWISAGWRMGVGTVETGMTCRCWCVMVRLLTSVLNDLVAECMV